MNVVLEISDVVFTASKSMEKAKGLLGWISCNLNGKIRLDGLTLHRTQDGRPTLSFPARKSRGGRNRFYFRPLDNAARLEIERQVFRALKIEETSP